MTTPKKDESPGGNRGFQGTEQEGTTDMNANANILAGKSPIASAESTESRENVGAVPHPEPILELTYFGQINAPESYGTVRGSWRKISEYIISKLQCKARDKVKLLSWGPYGLREGTQRGNEHVTLIHLAVLDLDHNLRSVEPVLDRLRALGVAGLVYASPSDDAASGERRVRVVVPLAQPIEPHESRALRQDLAGRLGVEYDGSTNDPARPFFVGKITGTPDREHWLVEGAPIPTAEWRQAWKAEPTIPEAPPVVTAPTSPATDQVIATPTLHARTSVLGRLFDRAGLLRDDLTNGKGCAVVCPWEHEHSPGGGETATALFHPTHSGGWGGFKCSHAHCVNRTAREARQELRKRVGDIEGNFGSEECGQALIMTSIYVRQPDGTPLQITRPKACQANVQTVFELHPDWHGVVAFNEFTGDIVKRREPPTLEHERPPSFQVGPWKEADTARAKSWFTKNLGFEPENSHIEAAILVAAERNSFHPVREYLDALEWDGVPRLDTWLSCYMGARQDGYTAAVGAQLLIGMCARVYQPGCKLDTVVIFEGPQGARKSTACGVLAGEAWFSDTALDIGSKDAMQGMRGNWLIELAELASIKSARGIETLKAFLTNRIDDYRPSYGRRNQKFPRQCVFVATHNPDGNGYLVDPTGNRRFLPVPCGKIDIDALGRDRDQLFAEAVKRYRDGEQWWLDGEAQSIAADEQAGRAEEDPWQAPVEEWLANPYTRRLDGKPSLPGDELFAINAGITVGDVLTHALGVPFERQVRLLATRVGTVLRGAGWTTKGKARPRRYFPPGG